MPDVVHVVCLGGSEEKEPTIAIHDGMTALGLKLRLRSVEVGASQLDVSDMRLWHGQVEIPDETVLMGVVIPSPTQPLKLVMTPAGQRPPAPPTATEVRTVKVLVEVPGTKKRRKLALRSNMHTSDLQEAIANKIKLPDGKCVTGLTVDN